MLSLDDVVTYPGGLNLPYTPSVNSYTFGTAFESITINTAPSYLATTVISGNNGTTFDVPLVASQANAINIELTSADFICNPYATYTLNVQQSTYRLGYHDDCPCLC